jgi:DNA polymerase-3 subunit beta
MKIKIIGNQLKKGMKFIGKITKRKSALETLENILLETEKSFVKILFTNLETGLIYQSLVKTEKEGKICVKKDVFEDLVNYLDDEDIIELEEKDNFLKIQSSKFSSKIKKFSVDDFPILPLPKEEKSIFVNSKNFTDNLKSVLNFTSPYLEKPEISGVLLKILENEMVFVATDNFRLGEKKFFQKVEGEFPAFFIIPQESAKEIYGIFNNLNEKIKIYYSPYQIFLEKKSEEGDFPELIYISKLTEGKFPEYEGVIPQKFITEVYLKTEDFLKKIKMASVFVKKTNELELIFLPKENKIKILTENIDLGNFEAETTAEIKGKEISVIFNYKSLEEGIEAVNDTEFFIGIAGKDKPVLIKPKNIEDFIYILAPIKKD